ncbi:hypothetical protein [Amycolatopsis thermophila]|uniref:Uncharacterized protein n=1 Tax=Amycolatopsis thermophila TaxID=206084 RepID=A0ABU0EMX2_9PSEU|nr:hypothetical protein [Amycolatopsis thermophila]MDQ0376638.1 hypothetical protein [Amycolatopsis thermophila]
MGELGTAIILAMRDQGWTVVIIDATVFLETPAGKGRFAPIELFQDEHERYLRRVLLTWIVWDGLQWPWPPDHHQGIHGEVPRSE